MSNRTSGPIARIAPNHLITSDPDFWSKINAVRSPYRRAPWYYHAARFEPGKDNVFTECDNDRHDARRKKMAAGVSVNVFCEHQGFVRLSLRKSTPTSETSKGLVNLALGRNPHDLRPSSSSKIVPRTNFLSFDTLDKSAQLTHHSTLERRTQPWSLQSILMSLN